MDQAHTQHPARHGLLGGGLVALAGLLASLALVYSNATGVGEVAASAQRQQRIESALGAAAAARSALGQTLLLAGSTTDPAVLAASIVEARAILDALEQRIAAAADDGDAVDLVSLGGPAIAASDTVLAAVESGSLDQAAALAAVGAAPAFDSLVAELTSVRADLAQAIAQATAESSRVATASRFMVAFMVPSLGVVTTIVVARRRRRRERLAVELKHERAVNKSKDQLIANLSHELRTPLTGIYTSALTMEDAGFEDHELVEELTNVIIDQSTDLTRMVEDLLVSAQADAGRLRFELHPVDVAELVEALGREFDRYPADVTADMEPAEVVADSGRLRQLLRNLVSNAAKYGSGWVRLRGRACDSVYAIEVIDGGPGVPDDVAERMFERFVHRGDQPLIVGSVGLGLSISKVLTEGMGGTLIYRRSEDETVFEVSLDLAPTLDEPPSDPLPSEAAADLESDEISVQTG